jgi:DNA-binding transcriptional MerR regulator
MNCEQPTFLLDAEVVWIESNAPVAPSEPTLPLSISEVAERFGVTPRALRFYDSKGLITPRRDGTARLYGPGDLERLALILKAKKLGFTLGEIRQMIEAQEGRAATNTLKISRNKCLEQINMLERQLQENEQALTELRRIHTMLVSPAGAR